ncbi:GAF domain-containing sensor histidine kinase [Teichococcus oryzae]|uniref:GAF domain-containing sensor histidine kinase n=1 Tax=Teichococcus oryzae TaxID=1608942 RepID=UPI0019D67D37|nr:GAF domain-containing sensor histidine kinase [Pseudoroseomonas oryzae]
MEQGHPSSPLPPDIIAALPPALAADVAAVRQLDAVPAILRIVCDMTGLGFAAVARVTERHWIACSVLDRIGFGLPPGAELPVSTTFCNEIRASGRPIIMDEASADPLYRDHPTPRRYGLESYVAVPIRRPDGSVFGTLCALDPRPMKLRDGHALPTLQLFAELIGAQLALQERLATASAALTDAHEIGALREQFVAVLGHDLRDPLASVSAGVEVLGRGPAGREQAGIIGHMRQSCRRMAELVDNILDMARTRLGSGITLERRWDAQLADSLAQVIGEQRSARPEREIVARLALQGPVFCDSARIAQLLSNLLANALLHGAPGRPVWVDAVADASGFRLSVANEGPPIPPHVGARLFRPFTRGTAESDSGGLGLGLFIATEIARAHGGTLGFESGAVETRFTLALPPGPAARHG